MPPRFIGQRTCTSWIGSGPNRRIKKCERPVTRYRALAVAKSENFSDLVV
jgi:hypothetical protein